ncbi:MAG TPA: 16S rRNA (guanine(527)-N(7))-methyltransferase RsmG [Bacteroidales bacterium]|nr:16S rRNA (guanine(527)-N(7))-methyltransferase RsmG [Bacteroidales bacterium]
MNEQIEYYFPGLSESKKNKLYSLKELYTEWNSRINVISRKDIDNFVVRHVLHSLSIARVFQFDRGTRILDVGTGGGFPGIPLAIMFPESVFTLLDSTRKKINVVSEIASSVGLLNVTASWKRAEDETGKYDYVVSRAVTVFDDLVKLTSKNIDSKASSKGIITLKGGDLTDELGNYINSVKTWQISDFFDDEFFKSKQIIFLPF